MGPAQQLEKKRQQNNWILEEETVFFMECRQKLHIRSIASQIVRCSIEIGSCCQCRPWKLGKRMDGQTIDVFGNQGQKNNNCAYDPKIHRNCEQIG